MSYQTKHTPGPWRWEVHEEMKDVKLCGGRPIYDLTVLDVKRWGMRGGQIRLREPEKDGFNIMHNTSHWAVVVKGREHHAHWFKGISHPDAQLIEAAPLLLSALIKVVNDYEYLVDAVTKMHKSGNTYVKYPEQPEWYDEAKAAVAAAGVTI